MDMDLGCTPAELQSMIYQTVDANGMENDVHIRLMVTRGLKPTPYQNPNITLGKPTIVVAAEFKAASRVEPARYCSRRHRMQSKSRNKGVNGVKGYSARFLPGPDPRDQRRMGFG